MLKAEINEKRKLTDKRKLIDLKAGSLKKVNKISKHLARQKTSGSSVSLFSLSSAGQGEIEHKSLIPEMKHRLWYKF